MFLCVEVKLLFPAVTKSVGACCWSRDARAFVASDVFCRSRDTTRPHYPHFHPSYIPGTLTHWGQLGDNNIDGRHTFPNFFRFVDVQGCSVYVEPLFGVGRVSVKAHTPIIFFVADLLDSYDILYNISDVHFDVCALCAVQRVVQRYTITVNQKNWNFHSSKC